MVTLEEYIKKRREDDQIEISDVTKKDENLQICINYIFEYFNTYINITEQQQLLIETNEKIMKYRNQLSDYSPETQTWLLHMYEKNGKKLHTYIKKELNTMDIFLLVNSEAEFRKRSYQCYSSLVKKFSFIDNYTEELYEFIKDQHRIWSNNYLLTIGEEGIYMNEKINSFLESTCKKYKINLLSWAEKYAEAFFDYENIWPISCKHKENYGFSYDVTKAKKNKFNIDYIYSQVSGLPYIKGKKQILEALVIYYWNDHLVGVDETFYLNYMEKICGDL